MDSMMAMKTCPYCQWINLMAGLVDRDGRCGSCNAFIYLPEKEKKEMSVTKHTIPLAREQVKEFIENTIDRMGGWTLFSENRADICSGIGRMGIEFPFNVSDLDDLYKQMYQYIPSTAPVLMPISAWVCEECETVFQMDGSCVGNPECPECGTELDLYESMP